MNLAILPPKFVTQLPLITRCPLIILPLDDRFYCYDGNVQFISEALGDVAELALM